MLPHEPSDEPDSVPNQAAAQVLAPLSPDQQYVIDRVGDVYFGVGGWPTFQYVQAESDVRCVDVRTVLSALPTVGAMGIDYSATNLRQWTNVAESYPVQLTVLGLHHYHGRFQAEARGHVVDILSLIGAFAALRRGFQPNPLEVSVCRVTSEQMLEDPIFRRESPPLPDRLYSSMTLEPPFFYASHGTSGPEGKSWHWDIPRQALDWEGLGTVEEYVARIATVYPPSAPPPAFAPPAPRSLPAALDYLDTVWRLAHGAQNHLVRLPSAERIFLLAYGVANREEFLERTSTLGDVFKNFVVPRGGDQKGGHPLERLGAYLPYKLPDGHERAARALDMLNNVRTIRDAGTHTAAETRAVAAYRDVGLSYPIDNWPTAWEAVSNYTVRAVDVLREEVSRLSDPPVDEG